MCVPSRTDQLSHSTTLYSANGASSNPLSIHEERISKKVSSKLKCPALISLSLPPEMGVSWDSVDPVHETTFGHEVEKVIFEQISGVFTAGF